MAAAATVDFGEMSGPPVATGAALRERKAIRELENRPMAAGRVVFVSRNGAILVVRHDDGFAVVELIGDEGSIAVGDAVAGDWDANGREPLVHEGRGLDAYFQGSWGSDEAAVQIARNLGG